MRTVRKSYLFNIQSTLSYGAHNLNGTHVSSSYELIFDERWLTVTSDTVSEPRVVRNGPEVGGHKPAAIRKIKCTAFSELAFIKPTGITF